MTTTAQSEEAKKSQGCFCEEVDRALDETKKLCRDFSIFMNTKRYFDEKEEEKRSRRDKDEQE